MTQFLDLPLEIRYQIYEYVAVNDTAETTQYSPFRGYLPQWQQPATPAILRTCHRIRREATPVLRSQARFRFVQSAGSLMTVWSCGSLRAESLRSLGLQLDSSSCGPAVAFLRDALGCAPAVHTVQVHWVDGAVRQEACDSMADPCGFWRPCLEYLREMKGLRTLMLTGSYTKEVVELLKGALPARVVAS
ncbi:hypothetical protein F4780DRAFT_776170 [Xylariomycetidae sp. FL0641]|nr:hypothetical protein F4780DRAFT_776170 [Xylariomycetidae sp. FL0641]